jgi:hypothetical protein
VKFDLASIAASRAARTAKSVTRAEDSAPIVAWRSFVPQIAAGLNERGIATARGGEWSVVQVQRGTSPSSISPAGIGVAGPNPACSGTDANFAFHRRVLDAKFYRRDRVPK